MLPFFTKLDWPAIPELLVDQLLSANTNTRNLRPQWYHHYDVSSDLLPWCVANLPEIDSSMLFKVECMKYSDLQSIDNNEISKTTSTHKDLLRSTYYCYFISDTGPVWHWYSENLMPAGEVIFEKHCWYKIDGQIFHATSNIEYDVVAFNIFKSDPHLDNVP